MKVIFKGPFDETARSVSEFQIVIVRDKTINKICKVPLLHRAHAGVTGLLLLALVIFLPPTRQAMAQAIDNGGWQTDLDVGAPFPTSPNLTVIPRTQPNQRKQPKKQAKNSGVKLLAFLTEDGQRIDRGLVWRIYEQQASSDTQPRLLETRRSASPTVQLKPGDYLINAAFGRAHLTRKLKVSSDQKQQTERFVLNAGGLRVRAQVDSSLPGQNKITYNIYEGERDQSGERALVLANIRPNLIIRLNSGIYHIVSTCGDANATVSADITVESGKLSEASLTHAAARVTFKLVTTNGGEARPGTRWTLRTSNGEIIKQSVGALPTHVVAPGDYTIVGRLRGQDYQRDFTITSGESREVEVLIQ